MCFRVSGFDLCPPMSMSWWQAQEAGEGQEESGSAHPQPAGAEVAPPLECSTLVQMSKSAVVALSRTMAELQHMPQLVPSMASDKDLTGPGTCC